MLLVMKTLKDEQKVVITGYKLAVFEILIFCISIYYTSALSLHIESTDSDYASALFLDIESTDSDYASVLSLHMMSATKGFHTSETILLLNSSPQNSLC